MAYSQKSSITCHKNGTYTNTQSSLKRQIMSERSRAQRNTYYMIVFVGNVQKGNFIETESRLEVARNSEVGWRWCWL